MSKLANQNIQNQPRRFTARARQTDTSRSDEVTSFRAFAGPNKKALPSFARRAFNDDSGYIAFHARVIIDQWPPPVFGTLWSDPGPVQLWENERMILEQSYVLLAVAIVVALVNFLGAYFAVRRARAKRAIQ
jgi:hypothetical protein